MNENVSLPNFTMLIGISGSGKSSYIKNLIQKEKFSCVCPDEIRLWLTKDMSDQTQNDVIWKIALYTVIHELKNGLNVVLDATNVNTSLRRLFIRNLEIGLDLANVPISNFSTKAIIFDINPESAIDRIKNYSDKIIKRVLVPDDIIYRMYGEYLFARIAIREEAFWNDVEIIYQDKQNVK